MTRLLLAAALVAAFFLSPVPTAADARFARLSQPGIVAMLAEPPDATAAERQRQAAGRDHHQRTGQHRQHRCRQAGTRMRPRLGQESHQRLRHHPGRQPQQRQRPEPAPVEQSVTEDLLAKAETR